MASTIEIPTSMGSTTQSNIERFANQSTKIFTSRRDNGRFSQTDTILQNMFEFNEKYFKYLNEIGIPLNPIVYEIEKQDFDEIAKLGYGKYKSFTKYTMENTDEEQQKLIKSTKGECATAYEFFLKQCLPYIFIKHNKDNYFNVNILKNGKYTTERGSGERLIYFAEGLETKYQIANQEERNSKTIGSVKLREIMPNVTCDVNQSNHRGKKTILALQYLNDIYDLTFQLFKDEIVAPLTTAPKGKKNQIIHLNDSEQVLFKDKFYTKKKQDGEKTVDEVIEFTVFDLKLLGKPDNNLQTLITNYNESDTDQMMVNGKSINLDNIDKAFPRGVMISTFINMESITYVPATKHLHWNFKCYQIDVDRRYISLASGSTGTFNFKGLCQNNEPPQVFNISGGDSSRKEDSNHDEDDNDFDDDN
jgi:hypothetical protein